VYGSGRARWCPTGGASEGSHPAADLDQLFSERYPGDRLADDFTSAAAMLGPSCIK